MHQTIVRDDVRHREHPPVSGLGECVGAGARQGSLWGDQGLVHPVHPLDHTSGAGEIELGSRSARQDARARACTHQFAHRRRIQSDVGVEVNPWKCGAGGVAQAQRVRLARNRRFENPYALHLLGCNCSPVRATVRNDDDIELARLAALKQPPQVVRDHRFLVVRRYDDADRGLAHGRKNSGCAGRRSR
jgi:hypothetical protein